MRNRNGIPASIKNGHIHCCVDLEDLSITWVEKKLSELENLIIIHINDQDLTCIAFKIYGDCPELIGSSISKIHGSVNAVNNKRKNQEDLYDGPITLKVECKKDVRRYVGILGSDSTWMGVGQYDAHTKRCNKNYHDQLERKYPGYSVRFGKYVKLMKS